MCWLNARAPVKWLRSWIIIRYTDLAVSTADFFWFVPQPLDEMVAIVGRLGD